jgi:hypothetical protein
MPPVVCMAQLMMQAQQRSTAKKSSERTLLASVCCGCVADAAIATGIKASTGSSRCNTRATHVSVKASVDCTCNMRCIAADLLKETQTLRRRKMFVVQ